MRTFDEYYQILDLWEKGYKKKQIADSLTIPRRTVIDCIQRFATREGLLANIPSKAKRDNQPPLLADLQGNQTAQRPEIQENYAYLFGLYLGDGHIGKVRHVYRIRITLDVKYPKIIDACCDAIHVLLPTNKVSRERYDYNGKASYVVVNCYYKYWSHIFPQCGAGAKHMRPIFLQPWQQQIIENYPLPFFKGLYHSDGSRFMNRVNGKDYPRYQFTNCSDDICALFIQTTEQLGLNWTAKKRTGSLATDIFISRRADVAFLDTHVGSKT